MLVFVALVLKFKLVISAEKAKYISTENLFKIPQSGVKKIRLAGLKNTYWREVDLQDGKSSRVCVKFYSHQETKMAACRTYDLTEKQGILNSLSEDRSETDTFSSSEAALLLVGTKNPDLWPCPCL